MHLTLEKMRGENVTKLSSSFLLSNFGGAFDTRIHYGSGLDSMAVTREMKMKYFTQEVNGELKPFLKLASR